MRNFESEIYLKKRTHLFSKIQYLLIINLNILKNCTLKDSGNRKIWKCQPRTRSEKPPCPKSGSDIETRGKTAQSDSLVGPKNYVSYHDPEQSAHCITVIKVQTNDIGTCGVLHQQKPNLSVHFIGPFTQFRANQSRNSQLENAEAVHFTEDRLQYSLEEEEKVNDAKNIFEKTIKKSRSSIIFSNSVLAINFENAIIAINLIIEEL